MVRQCAAIIVRVCIAGSNLFRVTGRLRACAWTNRQLFLSVLTGQPVAWKLVPGPTPPLYANPSSSHHRRGKFATKVAILLSLWRWQLLLHTACAFLMIVRSSACCLTT
jgi:hypothetical protein